MTEDRKSFFLNAQRYLEYLFISVALSLGASSIAGATELSVPSPQAKKLESGASPASNTNSQETSRSRDSSKADELTASSKSNPAMVQPIPDSNITEELGSQGTFVEDGIAFQISPEYSYDPNNRRDPFRPFWQTNQVNLPQDRFEESNQAGGPVDPKTSTALVSPLENYDVAQFKLLGVIWKVKNPKAVVKDPSNKQHIIYKYTRIGRNNGFVGAIKEGEVVIVEPGIGDNGMPSAITKTLELKK